jgi:hypothetical protein
MHANPLLTFNRELSLEGIGRLDQKGWASGLGISQSFGAFLVVREVSSRSPRKTVGCHFEAAEEDIFYVNEGHRATKLVKHPHKNLPICCFLLHFEPPFRFLLLRRVRVGETSSRPHETEP